MPTTSGAPAIGPISGSGAATTGGRRSDPYAGSGPTGTTGAPPTGATGGAITVGDADDGTSLPTVETTGAPAAEACCAGTYSIPPLAAVGATGANGVAGAAGGCAAACIVPVVSDCAPAAAG